MATHNTRRWTLGGAGYVARTRLDRGLDPVVRKLAQQTEHSRGHSESEHPDPSAEELANVRQRFVEWRAIEHAMDSYDAQQKANLMPPLFGTCWQCRNARLSADRIRSSFSDPRPLASVP